jgi:plastocyanin
MVRSWFGRYGAINFAPAVAVLLVGGSLLSWHSLAAMSSPREVAIDNFTFGAGTPLTVPRGTKVTWTNKDDDPHTVTSDSDPKLFKSSALDTDESFSFTFNEAGTFKYFCSIHPRMQGTVIVQ